MKPLLLPELCILAVPQTLVVNESKRQFFPDDLSSKQSNVAIAFFNMSFFPHLNMTQVSILRHS